jgi:serine/threonine-protein kinase
VAEVAGQTVVDGRYKITSRIGSGGMADVYCAADTHLGRDVALKILHRRFSQDEEFVERFRREASAAAGLQHPNVVSVYDRGSHDDTWYIAMELLKGRSLKDVIRQDAPIDQRRAIDLVIQILQAASFAHKRGVVHRDFKPHNVIVADDDSLKVTDFGIARAGASEMTETGSIMGTAQYLSPEQAQGQRVDARSDLYSIGVILFELLTGGVPFSGESAVSIALKHVSEPAPDVRQLRADVHPALAAVVARALVKDQAGRFQSAEEFILALDDARREIAAGPGVGESTGRWAPAGPVPPVGPPFVDDGYPYDEGDRDGRRKWPWVVLGLVLLGVGIFLLLTLLAPAKQVEVPRVEGLTVERATARLKSRGFDVKQRTERNDEKIGIVIGSDPGRGEEADEGSTVTLIVSAGPGEREVPDVQGFSQSRAEKELQKAGFKTEVEEKSSKSVESGRTIETDPPAGEVIESASTVTIVVSSGPEQVTVPNVVGTTRDSAVDQLRDAGFQVKVNLEESDKPEDEVIEQLPTANGRVDDGSLVTITVSEGRPTVEVPQLTGRTLEEAREVLSQLNLKATTEERDVVDPAQVGTVIEQDPVAGREVEEGDTVTLVIGREANLNGDDGADEGDGDGGTTP